MYLDAIHFLLIWVIEIVSIRTTSDGTRNRAIKRSHFPLVMQEMEGGGSVGNWVLNFSFL